MSAGRVTLLDARWDCKPGASACLTGRALTAEVVEAMSVVETCAQPDEDAA